MKTFLVVLFLINGEPTVVNGWLPAEQPDPEVCNMRAGMVTAYIESLSAIPPAFIGCVTAETGVDAALMLNEAVLDDLQKSQNPEKDT